MKRLVTGKRTSRIVTAVAMALTLVFLGWLVWREREVFVDYAWQIRWGALVAAIIPLFPALIIVAVAWASLMRTMGSHASFLSHTRVYVMAHLARRLPGTIWYIVGRGYLYQQQGESVRLVSAASGLELVLTTLAGGIVVLALGSSLMRNVPGSYMILLAALIAAALALSHPRTIRAALHWAKVEEAPPLHYGHILLWLAEYAAVWVLGGIMLYLIAFGLVQLSPTHALYVIAAWTLTGTLSIVVFFLPSNFGFTEVALSVLLSAVMPSSLAVVVAVASRIAIIVLEVVVTGTTLGAITLLQRWTAPNSPVIPPEYPQGGIEETTPTAYVEDGQ